MAKYLYICETSSCIFENNVISGKEYNVEKIGEFNVQVAGMFHKKETDGFVYSSIIFPIQDIKNYLTPVK